MVLRIFHGKYTNIKMVFLIVNGKWGGWNSWSNCTVSCGGGNQTRNRFCDHPLPQFGGAICAINTTLVHQVNNDVIEERHNQRCNENRCRSKVF